MLRLRKIFFYIFCLIYLVLTPLIIARMLGFVSNPLTHRFVKTGLVYVSTNPPQATVFIDGRMIHEKTPTVIRDLPPGEHFIRLELNGYKNWKKNIPIIARKATVLANTLLIPEEWPIKEISDKPYQNLIPASAGILVAINPVLKDIDIFHPAQGANLIAGTPLGLGENFDARHNFERAPLFSSHSIYADGKLVRIFNADKSPFILLEAAIKDKHKFLWCSLREKPCLIEDITDLFAQTPQSVAWNSSDDKNIFAFYPSSICRINIKTKTIYPQQATLLPEGITPNLPSGGAYQSFLINDKNDLLIREGPWIRIYPKNNLGVSESYAIAKSRPLTNMYFEEKNGELFYLDDDAMFLYAVEILKHHPILNIPVPEKLRTKIPDDFRGAL